MRTLLLLTIVVRAFSASSAVDHWETVVYENDTWRYLVPTAAVSPNWINLSFNAGSWSTGAGGFGYGDSDDNTTFGASISCYQRITFNIVDVNAIDAAFFHIDYDDAFVAYLNGVEIARSNITSTGQPAYNQAADGLHEAQMYSGGSPDAFFFDAAFVAANLVSGANVLCIQTHNESSGSSDMSSRAFLTLGINDTSSNYGPTPSWFVAPFVFQSSDLPIVVINTSGGLPIPDEPKLPATMGIIYNGPGAMNDLSDPFNEFDGNIGIEVRGSSSSGFPKQQYGIETRDPSGIINDVSFFDMAYDNDWVLSAPYSDKSLMRNVLTYKMGWDTDNYAPRTQYCELMLNGQYQGVYVLMEKIKRKDGKVGIDSVLPTDLTGNELTGDYVLKVDKLTANGVVAWTSPYTTYPSGSSTIDIQLHDPELAEVHPTQLAYIENAVTAFETALRGNNFTDPVLGYAPYIDKLSFIDFILVNEFGKNVDGYRISTFFHKRRLSEGGKIVAGPLWDFNLAFGNADYCNGGETDGWEIYFNSYCGGGLDNPFWFERLTQDPVFANEMHCRWRDLRAGVWHTDTLMAYIDSMALYLDQSQQRNFQQWNVLGTYVWPNNFVGATYAEEIGYLKSWITSRADWMDANMFGTCPNWSVDEFVVEGPRVFPNPANESVTFEFSDFQESGRIQLIDAGGKIARSVDFNGTYHINIELGGISPGMYSYQIVGSNHTINGKLSVQ